MIYKRMSGRLGNQMFQYAAIRSFHNKYRKNDDIYLDFQDVYKLGSKDEGFKNSLDGFKLNDKVHFVDYMKMDFIPTILFLFYKFLCMILKITNKKNYITKRKLLEDKLYPFYHKQGLYIYTDGFKEFECCSKKNIYFFGYYESVDYFKGIEDILRDEFSSEINLKNDDLLEIINNSNSTCISVRAGDFLSSKFVNNYYVCKPNYYLNGIQKMNSISNNNVFIVFSDDIEWVKNNIIFSSNDVIYYEEKKYNLYEKIYLMTRCKNYIISNSSFSFWTEFLSYNTEKIVIAPNKWSNDNKPIDIYEDFWIKLEIKEE